MEKFLKISIGFCLILPFVVSFFSHILINFKNKILLRRLSSAFCFLNFVFCSGLFFSNLNLDFSFFGVNFLISEKTTLFLFFNSLLFLLFVFSSKTFINKFHKIFYSNLVLYLGLINLFFFCDGVFLSFGVLFLIFLLNYLFSSIYSKDSFQKELKARFGLDFLILFLALGLILFDFSRYFIANDLGLLYSNMRSYLGYVQDSSCVFAFFGFLIVAFRLLNLVFGFNFSSLVEKKNNFLISLNLLPILLLGGYYFLLIFQNFDFLFYKFQNYIVLFLALNMLYSALLSFRKDNVFKTSLFLLCSNLPFLIFILFSFEEGSVEIFSYSFIGLIFSYFLLFLVLLFQEKKLSSLDFSSLSRGLSDNKKIQILTLYSILNISFAPCFSLFYSFVLLNSIVFTSHFEGEVLNSCAWVAFFSIFLISISIFSLIGKIFIEPTKISKIKVEFPLHQRVCLYILVFLNILFSFFGAYLINGLGLI